MSSPRGCWLSGVDSRCVVGVVLCAVAAYGAACLGTFVYDDIHSVQDNTAIRSLSNVPRFFVDLDAFSALDNRMYRPVLLVTFAVNYAIAGASPFLFKVTNLLLHAATAVMVFGLARRLGLARSASFLGAALVAVHPLASEAVNMISGRSEVLLVAALLAGLHCHAVVLSGRRWAGAGTVAATVVACGAKETGVIMPVLLVVLEVLVGSGSRQRWRATALRLLPVVAVVVGYLVARKMLFGAATLAMPTWDGGHDPLTGAGRDLVTQLATMATLLPRCLAQAVLPLGCSIDPPVTFPDRVLSWPVLGGGAAIVMVTALGLWWPRRRPALFLATAVVWGTALPWVLIPLNVPLCEHRLYGPVVGLGLALAACWRVPTAGSRRWLVVGASGVALLGYGVVSTARSLDYRDEKCLWQRAYALNPASYRACYSIGVCLMRDGDLPAARDWMEQALTIYPDYTSAQKNIAELELQLGDGGDPKRAEQLARRLVERSARNPFYNLLLSRALAGVASRSGDVQTYDEAVDCALHVLDIAPPKGLVYRTASHARRVQGRLEAALALLDESIARGLDHSAVRLDRAELLLALQRDEQADAEVRHVLGQAPFEPRALDLWRRARARAPR